MSDSAPFAVWVRRTQNHLEYCAYPGMQSECTTVRGKSWRETVCVVVHANGYCALSANCSYTRWTLQDGLKW